MKILSLSGFIPEEICDTIRFIGYQGEEKISHYCGYAADYISQVLEDDSIDGAVFPKSCDSCRIMGSYLSNCKEKFLYQFGVPARQDGAAETYLAAEIQQYQKAVEGYYKVSITDIPQRIQKVNERNKELISLYENIENISYKFYLKSIHDMLQKPLYEQTVLSELPDKPANGKPIYLVGSFLSNTELAATIENAGMKIVGDNLTESKRLFSGPKLDPSNDIYMDIAAKILHNHLSPTQNNFRCILKNDLEEIKYKNVQGVIFATQKYCEPYDYLFSIYKKMLDEQGIPVLQVVMSNSTDNRKLEFAVEAFADIL
ncbi:2-hydroxyacyl-CoA dehydratase [bacterium 1XD42-1]|nr:2-hydroxyacyl-CoA dehydratase [bacterium 1XD42-8]RKJ64594.1 2-hydroxyacyl-CoA dehydratase [bacterium 1XD42-1]